MAGDFLVRMSMVHRSPGRSALMFSTLVREQKDASSRARYALLAVPIAAGFVWLTTYSKTKPSQEAQQQGAMTGNSTKDTNFPEKIEVKEMTEEMTEVAPKVQKTFKFDKLVAGSLNEAARKRDETVALPPRLGKITVYSAKPKERAAKDEDETEDDEDRDCGTMEDGSDGRGSHGEEGGIEKGDFGLCAEDEDDKDDKWFTC